MGHHHSHAHDGYYLDQFCLVALSVAFGGICLSLCTWQIAMLHMMLAPFLHHYVLVGGILLLVAALIRAALLWRELAMKATHEHHHAGCDHGADSVCGHGHHDHDWAPWRYVIVLVPIILFLLGLPNRLPELRADGIAVDATQEALDVASFLAVGDQPLACMTSVAALPADSTDEPAPTVMVSKLEEVAKREATREQWQGERVRVEGVFQPTPSPRQFQIVRLFRFCCYGDARPVRVNVLTSTAMPSFPGEQWLAVTGTVGFRNSANGIVTVLQTSSRNAVVPTLKQSILEN